MTPPPATAADEWAWRLDEAAIREDGGAEDMAVAVGAKVASQCAYTPPTPAYERILWEATRTWDGSSSPPVRVAASAGWIVPRAAGTHPIFIAHTMLSAIWLLRQSLPDHAVAETAWAQLAQAASSVELAPVPTTTAAVATRSHTPSNPAKRPRAALEADSDVAPAQERVAVATVTSHNRRAETARKAKQAKVAERRREALGLVGPSSQAPVMERNAHGSISPQDEPTVAWIVKQPAGLGDFFHTARLPYATANTMLHYARSIGDETAKMHAAHFVHNWRRSGHPLLLANTHSPSSASNSANPPSSFQLTMDAITSSESVSATAGIVYRWGMAQLGQRYAGEIALLQAADQDAGLHGGRRDGDGQVRTQAKKAIWDKEQPRMSWSAYNARLKRSRRWFQAAQTLGWGFLVLVPTTTITPNWVEQTLRAAEWDIWLRLVERVNPAAVQASRDFDAWVGPLALQNGSIQDAERLRLEARLESRIHEVPDSDEERGTDSESDSGDEAGGGISGRDHRSHQPVTNPAAVLSSLDLRELFRPAGAEDASQCYAEP